MAGEGGLGRCGTIREFKAVFLLYALDARAIADDRRGGLAWTTSESAGEVSGRY